MSCFHQLIRINEPAPSGKPYRWKCGLCGERLKVASGRIIADTLPEGDESEVHLTDYVEVFIGETHTVALAERGPNDLHVVFLILTKDDDRWYNCEILASSAWITEATLLLAEAYSWLKLHCDPDDEGGWRFRYDQRNLKRQETVE